MSRTKKKPYTGSKRLAPSCRNHGSCRVCTPNRCKNIREKTILSDDSTRIENDY